MLTPMEEILRSSACDTQSCDTCVLTSAARHSTTFISFYGAALQLCKTTKSLAKPTLPQIAALIEYVPEPNVRVF